MSREVALTPSHRADEEPPSPRAPGKPKSTSFTPIAWTVPGVVRECDSPVLPCSAFRLLSSLSHSRVGNWQWPEPPSFVDASARSLATPEEPPLSWGRVTQALRRSPRHPWLSLERRGLPLCGAETRRHTRSPVTRRSTRATPAQAAPRGHVGQPVPKTPSKESHETRSRLEEWLRVARYGLVRAPKHGFVTVCHGLNAFCVSVYVAFCLILIQF